MRGPVCDCGHAWSSHRQDPDDPYVPERCKTCRCAGFQNRDEHKMQNRDDETYDKEARADTIAECENELDALRAEYDHLLRLMRMAEDALAGAHKEGDHA